MDTLLDRAWPNGPTEIHLHHLGGAVARYGDDHAAYRNREAAFASNLLARWADPAKDGTAGRGPQRPRREERFGTGGCTSTSCSPRTKAVRATVGADAYARLVALGTATTGQPVRLSHDIRPRG